jgi:hypothetical protein
VSLDATRRKPARQPEAVAAGFGGRRNPRDRAAGPDRLIPPAMQHGQQPFWAGLQPLGRLTLNTRNDAANKLDWLNSTTAMIVLFWSRATRDVRRSFGWDIAALHRLHAATKLPRPRRPRAKTEPAGHRIAQAGVPGLAAWGTGPLQRGKVISRPRYARPLDARRTSNGLSEEQLQNRLNLLLHLN